MLVRFLNSGPIKFGPALIHGLQGQIADLDGADLEAALSSGMVELLNDTPPTKKAKAK